jgi:hypothetical protein
MCIAQGETGLSWLGFAIVLYRIRSCGAKSARCQFSEGTGLDFVRELADGVLSSAAVPRGGLWPPPPPLCRCAEYTADQLSHTWWAIHRVAPTIPVRSYGAWCARRSGIKEEPEGPRREAPPPGAVHTKCQSEHSTSVGSTTALSNKFATYSVAAPAIFHWSRGVFDIKYAT